MRPNLLLEPQGPQGRVQRHFSEHAGAICPFVQILDAPVPQTVDQLPNIVQFFAALSPVPEQVIAVPKILSHDVPRRHFCREPQLVEQLVEVPTIISCSSLLRTTEQHVDIPVPGLGGRYPGLQGLLSGQSSTASQVALERLSERIAEQIVDFPVSRGDLPVFRPAQGSSSSSHDPARVHEALDEPGEGFFLTLFPKIKKCDTTSALGVGTASALEPMDAGCL